MSPTETATKSETRKKRIILIVIGVLAFLYIGPGAIVRFFLPPSRPRMQDLRRAPVAQSGKPAVAQPASVASAPVAAPAVSGVPPRLLGTWTGMGSLPNHPFCTVHLEVRNGAGEAPYSGYVTVSCMPSRPSGTATGGMEAIARAGGLNPAAAILLGDPKGDSIVFRVKDTVGVRESTSGCAMTSAALIPFGSSVAFKWTEKDCSGGEILMMRAK